MGAPFYPHLESHLVKTGPPAVQVKSPPDLRVLLERETSYGVRNALSGTYEGVHSSILNQLSNNTYIPSYNPTLRGGNS